MKPNIKLIIGSTRQNRASEKVAKWAIDLINSRGDMDLKVLDLKEWDLPMLYSPTPPSVAQSYDDEKTNAWAKEINEADGIIFITPEYNHGYPAVLKNSIDLIFKEWFYKPAAFVSYGSIAAGQRAVEQLIQVVVETRMIPLRDRVAIPLIREAFDQQGKLKNPPNEAAKKLFDELVWYAKVMHQARQQKA